MTPLQVLHVDDDEGIRALIELSFSLAGDGVVRSSASGADALATLGSGYRPDVVLLDVMMPDMDGPGVMARMRELPGHEATPVVFMTARAQSHEHDRFMALGAMGVITKPFDPIALAGQIRSLLGQRRS